MRPVDDKYEVSQEFGAMATAGVRGNIHASQDTVEYWVGRYGNYQPFGHAGMDFACPIGTPIYAMADGVVLYAGWSDDLPGDDSWSSSGYFRRWALYKYFPGIVTVIQHTGWISITAHQSTNDVVSVGQYVREGQVIGKTGNTSSRSSTLDSHLHVEALIDLNYPSINGLIYGRTNPRFYFGKGVAAQGTTTPSKEPFTVGQYEEINKKLDAIAKTSQNTWAGVWTGGTNVDGTKFNYGALPIVAESQRQAAVAAAQMQAQLAGLVGAIAALSKGEPFDEAKLLASVQASAKAGTTEALKDGTVTVDVTVNGKEGA